MKTHPFSLVGWLLAATLLLSLVGLTAEPLPLGEADAVLSQSFDHTVGSAS